MQLWVRFIGNLRFSRFQRALEAVFGIKNIRNRKGYFG
jgi:hypothetical protein